MLAYDDLVDAATPAAVAFDWSDWSKTLTLFSFSLRLFHLDALPAAYRRPKLGSTILDLSFVVPNRHVNHLDVVNGDLGGRARAAPVECAPPAQSLHGPCAGQPEPRIALSSLVCLIDHHHPQLTPAVALACMLKSSALFSCIRSSPRLNLSIARSSAYLPASLPLSRTNSTAVAAFPARREERAPFCHTRLSPGLHRTMATGSSPPPAKDTARREARGFRYWLDVQTQWSSNDQYGHVNNVVYYTFADAAINSYLIESCGLEPFHHPSAEGSSATATATTSEVTSRDVMGLMISTSATYYAATSFPCVLRVGMRIIKLGSSSVLYELGMFEVDQRKTADKLDDGALAATVTRATHVFVDRVHRRPIRPMPRQMSEGLAKLVVEEFADGQEATAKL